MFDGVPVVARKIVGDEAVSAEYTRGSGRLRIISGARVHAEWFPPHSWFAVASVSRHSRWGTSPTEDDLLLLIDNYLPRMT